MHRPPCALTEHRHSAFLIFAHATTNLRRPATTRWRVPSRARRGSARRVDREAVREHSASVAPSRQEASQFERAAAVGPREAARAAKLGHGVAAAVVDFSVIGPDEHGRVYHQNAFGYGGRKQDERARWSYNPVQPRNSQRRKAHPRSSSHPRTQPSLLLLRRFLLDGAGAASGSGAGSSASSLSSIAL